MSARDMIVCRCCNALLTDGRCPNATPETMESAIERIEADRSSLTRQLQVMVMSDLNEIYCSDMDGYRAEIEVLRARVVEEQDNRDYVAKERDSLRASCEALKAENERLRDRYNALKTYVQDRVLPVLSRIIEGQR